MARGTLILLSLSIFCYLSVASTDLNEHKPSNFIETSCKNTTYPKRCEETLASYTTSIKKINPLELVQTALLVSLDDAKSTMKDIYKLGRTQGLEKKEYAAIKICIDQMYDSLDSLKKSQNEINQIGEYGRSSSNNKIKEESYSHVSNVQTWMSTVLTDVYTCIDGFAAGKMKNSVQACTVDYIQDSSNALALVNELASNYY
ncbi:hypothetical protein ACFE04_029071 [Oxalis oulophora]